MKALAFSGGKDSMACLHLLRDELDCAIYVDTGFAYPETHAMVAYAAKMTTMHIVHSDRLGQNAREGIPSDVVPVEWTPLGQRFTTTNQISIQPSISCCYENLSRPLLEKAKSLQVTDLYYGQRHEESYKAPSRDGDVIDGMRRHHPIEHWTTRQVLDYLAAQMPIPEHYAITRSSLDCYDCPAYLSVSSDLVRWTESHHPDYYAAYLGRRRLVDEAVDQALLRARPITGGLHDVRCL
jgi:phosphoadenosine phosphosulfate reductase